MRRRRIIAIGSIFLLLGLAVWLVFTYVVLPVSVVELQVWTAEEIGTVHQLVGANSYGPDITGLYQDQVAYDLFQNLGLQRLRVWCRFGWQLAASSGWETHHTIFNGTSFEDAQNPNFYNWTYLDLLVDVINNTGSKPILTFTGCPRSLHPNWAPNKGPVNLTIYAEVVAHVVMHYEQGWPGIGQIFDFDYIEIGNEPNLPAFWDGTQQEFFDLYNIVSRRLALIGSLFKIGGPGLADIELTNWTTNFLSTVNGLGLPLDFFSWHAYWNDPGHVIGTIHTGTTLLRNLGFGHIDQVFDEYGLDLLSDTEWGTMTAAVHTTEVLMGAAKNGVDIACFGFAKDVPIHPNITSVFGDEANFGLLTRNPTTPKPTFHALKPFASITNHTILNATLVQPPMLLAIPAPISALVTRGPGQHNYTVLLSNHGIRSITVQVNLQGGPSGPFQIAQRELSATALQQYNDWTPLSQSTSASITVTCPPQTIQWLSIYHIGSNAYLHHRNANPFSSTQHMLYNLHVKTPDPYKYNSFASSDKLSVIISKDIVS
ncbi:MAG: hypothetical protein ACFFCH_08260 [Promethearchaeota archaeon]